MNTVERIVARYFEMVRRCLTVADVKVPNGNNRQFDLLALNPVDGVQYHVESGVTHEKSWWPTLEKMEKLAREKFFGVPKPPKQTAQGTKVGKEYLPAIKQAYELYGFQFASVNRVLCCWTLKNDNSAKIEEHLRKIAEDEFGIQEARFEILSLRDAVIPELTSAVGKSNYDDDVLRMLSLLEQRRIQANPTAPRSWGWRGTETRPAS